VKALAAALETSEAQTEVVARVEMLQQWLKTTKGMQLSALEPKRFKADDGERIGLITSGDIQQDQVVLEIPEEVAITSIDAEKHPVVGDVAAECSELIALTLWLMAERAAGSASQWAQLLHTLPQSTESPILWDDQERAELLRGSPLLEEARQRQATLQQQWAQLSDKWFNPSPEKFSPTVFNESNFLRSFCVVLGHAQYLPSASCFALLPMVNLISRTGNENGCNLDYDADRKSVLLTAARPYRDGQEVMLNDGRPNAELLLSVGTMQDGNQSNCLLFPATLVAADKYYSLKQQVVQSFGFSASEQFPVYADRFPVQLLAYLRLSRIQDPALMAKVTFEQDVVITQMNEYEVLQLLMGECRERLAAYQTTLEEETKLLQGKELTGRARVAARLRVSEKKILSQFMDAVRRKLAPIRGIPTKAGGMQDPNQDLKEIFDIIEDLPNKPAKLFDGLRRWAQGEFDPDWKK